MSTILIVAYRVSQVLKGARSGTSPSPPELVSYDISSYKYMGTPIWSKKHSHRRYTLYSRSFSRIILCLATSSGEHKHHTPNPHARLHLSLAAMLAVYSTRSTAGRQIQHAHLCSKSAMPKKNLSGTSGWMHFRNHKMQGAHSCVKG